MLIAVAGLKVEDLELLSGTVEAADVSAWADVVFLPLVFGLMPVEDDIRGLEVVFPITGIVVVLLLFPLKLLPDV